MWEHQKGDITMAYKLILIDEDGYEDEQDEIFETEEEAEDYALYLEGCAQEGAEILHMSNPGDYPDEEAEEFSYRIEEV